MHDITPETFLKAVFSLQSLGGGSILYTTNHGDRWSNKYWPGRRSMPIGAAATYYCVSTVRPDPSDPYPRRSYRHVYEAWVVVCDDIGTKARAPALAPSYIIETSADNYQYGYFIEPWDVTTGEGRVEYDAVLYSLVKAGHNDPGARGASRVVRLPGSLHRTGFVSTVVEWAPERIWELEGLLPAMRVEKDYPVSGRLHDGPPGKHKRLVDVTDPAYRWLADNWTVRGVSNEWVYIDCPWRSEHTDKAQGATSTAYSPEDFGSHAAPAFKCLHGHCAGRGLAAFRAWLEERGCDVVWGDADLSEEVSAALAAIANKTEGCK